jgi:hypothetical protein
MREERELKIERERGKKRKKKIERIKEREKIEG